ncbi:DUF4433 domain-containing protein [Photobacterium carnosum]|nr:DarT ssDNA thymidine ADP-ribosyltransferase family protein [Photobacterium carnosum]MBY3788200.1 DUF4433 domain-containing protein [Photobacterium carnosum]MCD9533366.1 DUF4433 domain-containing protein [Photobacterium carnosum]
MSVKVSHITHVSNLNNIIAEDCLWSDAKRIELNLTTSQMLSFYFWLR